MLERIKEELERCGLEGMIICRPANIQYASGFTGTTATLLVSEKQCYIISDFRYEEQIAEQVKGFTYVESGSGHMETAASLISSLALETIGFEEDYMTVEEFQSLEAKVNGRLVPSAEILYRLRSIKTPEEVAWMEQAASIADQAFTQILGYIKPGITELDVACELEYRMKKLGAEGFSFHTIVASGPNTSMPHHETGSRKLQNGDFVLMDYGCKVHGYCSDMTRTVALGQVTGEMKRVYDTVLEAQKIVLEQLGKEKDGFLLDSLARDYINGVGYNGCFGHSLGHCLGLEVHEKPSLSPRTHDILQPGMVTSVEPGIYLEGKLGVRIEDICLVLTEGCKNLVTSDKELIIL